MKKSRLLGAVCAYVFLSLNAHAATVSYSLNNIIMHNDFNGQEGQMTGTFTWTYDDSGDFGDGAGEFSELFIPWLSVDDYALLNIIFDIGGSIEFNRDGTPSTHDEGIDINLKFAPALTSDGSALINQTTSAFDIGGNGFIFGGFTDGSISPVASSVPIPAAFPLFAGGFSLLGLLGWRRKRMATAA
jgi:hypothetical protein